MHRDPIKIMAQRKQVANFMNSDMTSTQPDRYKWNSDETRIDQSAVARDETCHKT